MTGKTLCKTKTIESHILLLSLSSSLKGQNKFLRLLIFTVWKAGYGNIISQNFNKCIYTSQEQTIFTGQFCFFGAH